MFIKMGYIKLWSFLGTVAWTGFPAYTAAKWAVIGFSKSMEVTFHLYVLSFIA